MKTIPEIRKAIEAEPARNAWARGVQAYALDLLAEVQERAQYEGHEPQDKAELNAWMLNGADNWEQYSDGGSALIYNGDIAERLCSPSELKRRNGGEWAPNCREGWLDVQTRALSQAARMIRRLAL